ncbi:hypothetical protein GEMRC1_004181 [Eukaryota sp. GEM-RC1]
MSQQDDDLQPRRRRFLIRRPLFFSHPPSLAAQDTRDTNESPSILNDVQDFVHYVLASIFPQSDFSFPPNDSSSEDNGAPHSRIQFSISFTDDTGDRLSYEDLIQLDDRPPEDISLEEVCVSKHKLTSDFDCSICFDTFSKSSEVYEVDVCKHLFVQIVVLILLDIEGRVLCAMQKY